MASFKGTRDPNRDPETDRATTSHSGLSALSGSPLPFFSGGELSLREVDASVCGSRCSSSVRHRWNTTGLDGFCAHLLQTPIYFKGHLWAFPHSLLKCSAFGVQKWSTREIENHNGVAWYFKTIAIIFMNELLLLLLQLCIVFYCARRKLAWENLVLSRLPMDCRCSVGNDRDIWCWE